MDAWDALDEESKALVREAEKALVQAYAPYSSFLVGAAIRLDNGETVTGTNQENAAYPSGMCAERVALFAKASVFPTAIIRKIALVAKRATHSAFLPVTPCGSCRQVLLEFELRQAKPVQIIMQVADGQWIQVKSAADLLPYNFSKLNLDRNP